MKSGTLRSLEYISGNHQGYTSPIHMKNKEHSPLTYVCVPCHAKSLQASLSLCDTMDCSQPGSSVHRIVQARILEWVVMPSSRESSWSRDWTHISQVCCFVEVFSPPLSFSHQENAMTTHSSILAWRIPWTEEPVGLQSIQSHRVGHDWSDLARMHAWWF